MGDPGGSEPNESKSSNLISKTARLHHLREGSGAVEVAGGSLERLISGVSGVAAVKPASKGRLKAARSKQEAKRIRRAESRAHVAEELNAWHPVVEGRRHAAQVVFPLPEAPPLTL